MRCRSIEYIAKERIEIIEIDVKDPRAGEVQIQTLACGICAWDRHVFTHGADPQTPRGHEGIGRVVKVGLGVEKLKEGDWVVGGEMGFAEFHTRPAKDLYLIPRTNREHVHWIVEPASCVVTGLDHCHLRAGDRVAVVGCGFMGQMFVQALAHSCLDRLIAIDIASDRLTMARRFGATHTSLAADIDAKRMEELSIDTVVDCSGSQEGLDVSSRIVRRGGRINVFGWIHGAAAISGDLWHTKGITLVNSSPVSAFRDPWPAAIRLIDRGIIDLKPLVSHVVPLADYPALLKNAANNRKYMKGVVDLATA
jgi:L-iditol 2-dehydrogenase